MKRFIVLSSLLTATGLACSLSSLPLIGGDSGPDTGGNVLYSDDFSSEASGWEVGQYSTGTVGYGAGVYRVTSVGNGSTMWGIANQNFTDLTISVDSVQVSGPANDNNDYGVICRLQEGGEGYYFLISGDGFFSILRADSNGFTPLIDWTSTDVVRQGNSDNAIVATCSGSDLSFYVNGQLLASTSDSNYGSGDVALTATSYEETGTEVHFDNFTVTQP